MGSFKANWWWESPFILLHKVSNPLWAGWPCHGCIIIFNILMHEEIPCCVFQSLVRIALVQWQQDFCDFAVVQLAPCLWHCCQCWWLAVLGVKAEVRPQVQCQFWHALRCYLKLCSSFGIVCRGWQWNWLGWIFPQKMTDWGWSAPSVPHADLEGWIKICRRKEVKA